MKVLIATEAYWPLIDGGAVAEHNLALELKKRGHDVHIIAPSDNKKDGVEDNEGTTIHRLSSYPVPLAKNDHRLAYSPLKKIRKIIDNYQPDIVHIHNPFPIGKATMKVCQQNNIPIIATNHWLPENILTFMAKFRFINSLKFLVRLNWKFIAKFHNQCQFVTSPTQTAVDLMLKNGLVAPNKPVSNGVKTHVFKPDNDPSALRARLNIPEKPVALYAGRLSGEKHVDVFVRSIPKVLENTDAHFIIGGNGRERDNLIALCESLKISDHVTFPGFLEDDEFPLLYNLGSVFVMPSICELQSITTLEALATGLPVVAANKYALPELVHEDINGHLFEPGDTNALSEKLIDLLNNPEKRSKMSKESLKIVSPHALKNAVTDYENIYKDLVSQNTNN